MDSIAIVLGIVKDGSRGGMKQLRRKMKMQKGNGARTNCSIKLGLSTKRSCSSGVSEAYAPQRILSAMTLSPVSSKSPISR